ncbi:response regulator transcription factor [Acidimangrovimonas sediminis]|uniref:response regulator transcription factor n=1 Tax=Acidimangrovimonas sediminis TaxID=2056283 RepID=UPI000C8104EE|nr:response regulator [Acidimangrovimonas sediminis]
MGNHVLLIEDEPNISEALRFLLTRDGWRVSTHADGRDAVHRVRSLRPDVLVLDVMLPGRSGFEVLEDLRADPGLAGLPVLMLTAKGQERDREQAERLGATRFMTKPFANTEILAAVRDLGAVHAAAGDATSDPEAGDATVPGTFPGTARGTAPDGS